MPMIIYAAVTAISGAVSAYGQYQQGRSQNSYYQYLAGSNRLAAAAALERSQKQSEVIQDSASIENKSAAIRAAEISSSQKTAMAANGIDLSSVSAQDITMDTLTKAKMDEMMIRRNADVQSWSATEEGKLDNWRLLEEAKQNAYAGKQAKKAGNIGAFTTLLGTASSILSRGMSSGGTSSGMTASAGTSGSGGSFGTYGAAYKAPSSTWLRSVR